MLVALAVPGFWLRRSASNTMLVACTKYAGWRRSSPLAMPQFWLRRPPGYASILAAPPSTRFPWLCLDSGCAALNSGCAATPLHKLRSPSEFKSPLCRSSGCRYINSSLLPNSSLLLISSGYAVLAAPYSIVASNNLDVAPEYSRCCHLFFLGFPSPETKL